MRWFSEIPRTHSPRWLIVLEALLAAAAFHAAYLWESARLLVGVFIFLVILMARAPSPRWAFYSGVALGMAIYAPQLHFFFGIFQWAAVPLWLVLSLWLGLFLLLAQRCRARWGDFALALLAPFLWTGLEYFRSELYYLRFSWLNIGYAFADPEKGTAMLYWGVYGVGFLLAALAGLLPLLNRRAAFIAGGFSLATLAVVCWLPESMPSVTKQGFHPLKVAGMQAEFPVELEVPRLLDQLVKKYPRADLLVLSEYTFDGPVPKPVKNWCRQHQKYLVVGGKEPAANGQFENTAYVIGPEGKVVFQQVKSVPIQFFKDGLPARQQELWDSPWGKLGLCICYDLSYRRVVDRLAKLGAQAIIVPTMDVEDWGSYEHTLHARIGPARAKEFGIPIIRLASSGVSQWVTSEGETKASAPFPGQKATLYGVFQLRAPARFPYDRWLAAASVAVTAGFCLLLCVPRAKNLATPPATPSA